MWPDDECVYVAKPDKLVVMVTAEHNPNPQCSKAHLTTLNLNFKMIEAMGLKIIASRSP
jgi:hypothetical protein